MTKARRPEYLLILAFWLTSFKNKFYSTQLIVWYSHKSQRFITCTFSNSALSGWNMFNPSETTKVVSSIVYLNRNTSYFGTIFSYFLFKCFIWLFVAKRRGKIRHWVQTPQGVDSKFSGYAFFSLWIHQIFAASFRCERCFQLSVSLWLKIKIFSGSGILGRFSR